MGRLSLERSPYYRFLSEDPNFRRWVSSVEEGSLNIAGRNAISGLYRDL